IGRCGPAWEHADAAAARAGGAAAHGDDAPDPERNSELGRRLEPRLRVGALGRVGMEEVAGGVDRGKANAEFAQLAGEPVALGRLADGGEVEMGTRPWAPGADAKRDVGDAALRTPGEQLAPAEAWERVGVDANSHETAFRKAEINNSTSRRACSTVVCTGAIPVAAAWKARSSSRNASS